MSFLYRRKLICVMKPSSLEKISYWLDKYEGKYAASPCSCRKSRKTFDEGCADDPADWCVAVGDMADYVVETARRKIHH